ncbi:MAG: Sec-independent protein translocase protein TatB [Anaerolineae bacterium]|nr:Sec-independent protein translocase protein TatB [Anaerolineae bacterium]MDW8101054.1 Sec-independent protein translocase protein TatB [Anaerolineae bacterium]
MNIFGVGPWEVVLIAILALIFIGPEKLPEIMRQIGRVVGELRRMSSEITREFQEELAPLQEIQSELTGTLKTGQKAAEKPQPPTTAIRPAPPSALTASAGEQSPSSVAAQTTSGPEKSTGPVNLPEKVGSSEETATPKPEAITTSGGELPQNVQDKSVTPTLSELPTEAAPAYPTEASDAPMAVETRASSNGPILSVEAKGELPGASKVLPSEPHLSSAE